MRRRILIAVAAVAALVLIAAAWTFWPRGTSEVSEDDALDDFREQSGEDTADEPTASATVPEPGVYTFRATGAEEVKLGPLPAQNRPFPERVTATVIDTGDGCFEITVSFFVEHTEDTRYCTSGGSLSLDTHTKHQQIGALSPTADMTCDPAVLLASDQRSHELACTLDLSGGPAAITATLAGTATRGATEEVTVGTDDVQATPLTIAYEVTGDLSGSWTETLWLTDANLPVRIERNLDLTGPATFTEESRLDLDSLDPTT